MRNLLITILFILIGTGANGQAKIAGTWNADKKDNTLIKIEKKDDTYIGKILSTNKEDVKPGTWILKDIIYVEGKWQGQICDPKRDKWYNAEFIPNSKELEIVVYIGFIRKTVTWQRT